MIATVDDLGESYYEISCDKHYDEMCKDADEKAPEVMKLFVTGTSRHKRGDVEYLKNSIKRYNEIISNVESKV